MWKEDKAIAVSKQEETETTEKYKSGDVNGAEINSAHR
jgi:hypothetical protein